VVTNRDTHQKSAENEGPAKLEDALTSEKEYSLLSKLVHFSPRRQRPKSASLYPEQYLMVQRNEYVVTHHAPDSPPGSTVSVAVPPLYHEIVTAKIDVRHHASALKHAQQKLDSTFEKLQRDFGSDWNTASGVGIVVAWGLPYFFEFAESLSYISDEYLPVDVRGTNQYNGRVIALLDAVRFPSDPVTLKLEHNDVAFVFVSDYLENIARGVRAIVDTELFAITSIRKGFVGSNFFKAPNEQSLVKQMANLAGIRGAEKIPDNAELFLGFTSTIEDSLGPSRIANFECLGITDQTPKSYFAHGTTMHLSHIYEDLDLWYNKFFPGYKERVQRMHGPARGTESLTVPEGTVTIDTGGLDSTGRSAQLLTATESSPLQASSSTVQAQVEKFGVAGHSASIQPVTRLPQDVTDPYGTTYKKGQAIPLRVDFNTLDNPFFYSSQPSVDRMELEHAAGVHFAVFVPTSDSFHRARLAQDGCYNLLAPFAKPANGGTTVYYDYNNPDYVRSGSVLMKSGARLDPSSADMGFNVVAQATHRQNFLVPPTEHRSFPLSELL
jgi:hypothetical protein